MADRSSKYVFLSGFRSRLQEPNPPFRRGYHVELGAREKALLEEDPALKRFKSYKYSVKKASKVGNALTFLVLAACGYEILTSAASKAL
ncbi:hypothetical protein HPP92_017347 [Vanilla planifolia]|uniref:Succinate dehydrogenase subunit 7, mitochondrial n=1 Tax=Vanilla planifolia TaxID=51239 RepID=A0A835UQV8_VANPL|nr:hypothetical protein HPP92_017347 [Vanilla planifolia]